MVRKKGEEKAVPLVLKIPIPLFYQMYSTLYTKKFGIIYHLQSWEPDGGFTQKCFLFIIRQSCVADVCFVIKEAFVEGAYPASADNWAFFHWPKKPPGWMRVEKFRVRSSLANWFFGQYWKAAAAPLVPPVVRNGKDKLPGFRFFFSAASRVDPRGPSDNIVFLCYNAISLKLLTLIDEIEWRPSAQRKSHFLLLLLAAWQH